ncbi:hypothetical protein OG588_48690 [Streptomyces prunicolor]|uniref:hypothetical protein n=1 Tax=Streptomyces prunicolor TaxID=67348 RepID=UPI00386F1248|nr:hypothetical protein OG588_48690 [Streptomyces prunicolor]
MPASDLRVLVGRVRNCPGPRVPRTSQVDGRRNQHRGTPVPLDSIGRENPPPSV